MIRAQQPDDINKVHIISPLVVIFSAIQFFILFFYKYVQGIDNTAGYVVGYFRPIIYVTSFILIVTVVNNVRKKTIGLLDMVLVAVVLVVSFVMFSS